MAAGCSKNSVEQCVLRLCYSTGVGGEGKLNTGRSLETGNSEHRTELLIAIRKALGSHERPWSRQSSKADQRWAMEEDSGKMRIKLETETPGRKVS